MKNCFISGDFFFFPVAFLTALRRRLSKCSNRSKKRRNEFPCSRQRRRRRAFQIDLSENPPQSAHVGEKETEHILSFSVVQTDQTFSERFRFRFVFRTCASADHACRSDIPRATTNCNLQPALQASTSACGHKLQNVHIDCTGIIYDFDSVNERTVLPSQLRWQMAQPCQTVARHMQAAKQRRN